MFGPEPEAGYAREQVAVAMKGLARAEQTRKQDGAEREAELRAALMKVVNESEAVSVTTVKMRTDIKRLMEELKKGDARGSNPLRRQLKELDRLLESALTGFDDALLDLRDNTETRP